MRIPPLHRAQQRKRILSLAKGFYGRAKNVYSIAVKRVHKGLQHAYVSRKLKKRDMRSLWINRITSGAQEYGVSYSKFMHGLNLIDCRVDRKILSTLAIHEPYSFRSLVDLASHAQSNRMAVNREAIVRALDYGDRKKDLRFILGSEHATKLALDKQTLKSLEKAAFPSLSTPAAPASSSSSSSSSPKKQAAASSASSGKTTRAASASSTGGKEERAAAKKPQPAPTASKNKSQVVG